MTIDAVTQDSVPPKLAVKLIAPDTYDRFLSLSASLLLLAVIVAILKGQATWFKIPTNVWAHLALIAVALALTPVMLLRKRGDRFHRQLGWLWASSLFLTALISFDIRITNAGNFSLIHLLSVLTIVQVPVIIWAARNHNIAMHRSAVRGTVTGALLIAGFFTFPFNRLLGQWLFG
jgi:uncharacterized membrane protein